MLCLCADKDISEIVVPSHAFVYTARILFLRSRQRPEGTLTRETVLAVPWGLSAVVSAIQIRNIQGEAHHYLGIYQYCAVAASESGYTAVLSKHSVSPGSTGVGMLVTFLSRSLRAEQSLAVMTTDE